MLSNLTERSSWVVVSAIFIITLTGCIPVEDIDDAWNKAKIDPELEGSWKTSDPERSFQTPFITFKKSGSSYEIESDMGAMPLPENMKGLDMPNLLARTLEFSGQKFLIIDTRPMMQAYKDAISSSSVATDRQTTSPEGGIFRYAIDGDTYTQYMLAPDKVRQAISTGYVKGTAPKPDPQAHVSLFSPSLSTLDDSTLQALAEMKEDKDAWRSDTYIRVKDVARELEKSRTYPASSETLANTMVNISSPDFQQLCEAGRNVLMRHLQASPEWNVHQEGFEDIVAYRREKVDGAFRDTSSGYHNEHPVQTRHLFRFTNSKSDMSKVPDRISGFANCFKETAPVAGDVALKLQKDEQGIQSYLAIGKSGVWFEFFEQSNVEERMHTRNVVSWLSDFAEDIVATSDEIDSLGYAEDLLPPDSIRQGQPQIDFVDGTLTAWLNPRRQGMVFLKVINGATNNQIEDRNYNHGGKESIGWSENPNTLFQYKQNLRHLAHVPKLSATLRIEVWFRPTDGKATPIWHEKTHPSDKRLMELVTKPPEL